MPGTARKTNPALWEAVKAQVTAADKGGEPGQWSARKAQRATAEYRRLGGGNVGPKTADNLAAPTGTHAPSLYRLMRALTNLNILTEDATHRFALTPLGEALKTGAPTLNDAVGVIEARETAADLLPCPRAGGVLRSGMPRLDRRRRPVR